MSDKPGSVLLVGSIPLESAEAVFRTCSQELGEHLGYLPDGEVGDRVRLWSAGTGHLARVVAYPSRHRSAPMALADKAI